MNNANIIRHMTDRQLADFLKDKSFSCENGCIARECLTYSEIDFSCNGNCREVILKWLKMDFSEWNKTNNMSSNYTERKDKIYLADIDSSNYTEKKHRIYSADMLERLAYDSEEYHAVVFCAESFYGKLLTKEEHRSIASLVFEFELDRHFIEYLLEYSASNKIKFEDFIKTAIFYHANGIDDIKKMKNYLKYKKI